MQLKPMLMVVTGVVLNLACSQTYGQFVSFRDETGANAATELFGASGQGVTVVIMDRGIDWDHPDFINPDGTTRIQWLYDMSPDFAQPVEFSAEQINAALQGEFDLRTRDAVGHGTVTAGLAAGNGSAAGNGLYRGMAPKADLIVVKLVSEGAPAHDDQPAELPFVGNYVSALDWVDEKIELLGQPAVGIINSGVQWGPLDGTSVVSQKIDEVFGDNRPGRIYVAPSGDAGAASNHARMEFNNTGPAPLGFNKSTDQTAYMQIWYTGSQPAEFSLSFDDGTTIGPILPNQAVDQDGVRMIHYLPHADLADTLSSSSGDRFVWLEITGHAGPGQIRVQGTSDGTGVADFYTPIAGSLESPIPFTDHLAPGRLTDHASTSSAIVAGAHVLLTNYVDIDGFARQAVGEGDPGQLWIGSSGGPTRDGRDHGVDLTTPGHNAFAAYAKNPIGRRLISTRSRGATDGMVAAARPADQHPSSQALWRYCWRQLRN